MRLLDANTGNLSGLKYKLVCHFKLAADMAKVPSGSLCMKWTSILKRELVWTSTGRSQFTIVHLDCCPFIHFGSI